MKTLAYVTLIVLILLLLGISNAAAAPVGSYKVDNGSGSYIEFTYNGSTLQSTGFGGPYWTGLPMGWDTWALSTPLAWVSGYYSYGTSPYNPSGGDPKLWLWDTMAGGDFSTYTLGDNIVFQANNIGMQNGPLDAGSGSGVPEPASAVSIFAALAIIGFRRFRK